MRPLRDTWPEGDENHTPTIKHWALKKRNSSPIAHTIPDAAGRWLIEMPTPQRIPIKAPPPSAPNIHDHLRWETLVTLAGLESRWISKTVSCPAATALANRWFPSIGLFVR